MNWGAWFAGLTNAISDDRMYDCLPIHHSVGGIVAPCSMLRAGASWCCGKILGDVLARYRPLGLHLLPVYRRTLPLPAEGAHSEFEATPAAARLRQRPARRYLAGVSGAFRDPADTRILRRDRRISRFTTSRESRARSAASRRSWRIASGCDRAPRRCARHAAARAGRPLHSLRPRQGGEAIGRSEPPMKAAAASRAIPTPPRPRRRSCATCWYRATPGFAPAI